MKDSMWNRQEALLAVMLGTRSMHLFLYAEVLDWA